MRLLDAPPLDAQRQFWNWHWKHWRERRVINDWTLARWDVILGLVRSLALSSPHILDMGCGRGWFTDRLAEFGQVTGVDLSDDAIAAARAEFPRPQFIAGNVYEVPLPDEHFDLVVSQEVISHVEDQASYVQRAADVLKPGRFLMVTTGNKFVTDRLGSMPFPQQPKEHISTELDMRSLKRLLRPHFEVLRTKTIIPIGDGGVLRLVNSYTINAVLGRLFGQKHLDAIKETAGLGYQLIVLAVKRME